jgi:hypothetical protein
VGAAPARSHPEIENSGWDWEEIAVLPLDPALRKGLHDNERVVLAEWSDGNPRKHADAMQLMALIKAEVTRLHGGVVR